MAAQWLTLPGSAGAREQEERDRLGRFQLTPWCRQFERTSPAAGLETHPERSVREEIESAGAPSVLQAHLYAPDLVLEPQPPPWILASLETIWGQGCRDG